jgi:hypothetical protein
MWPRGLFNLVFQKFYISKLDARNADKFPSVQKNLFFNHHQTTVVFGKSPQFGGLDRAKKTGFTLATPA